MTIEEKFKAGRVVYKNSEGNYVFEVWGGSTKHPDSIFHMEDFEMASWVNPEDDAMVRTQIFPWICECASKMMSPWSSYMIMSWAMDHYDEWMRS